MEIVEIIAELRKEMEKIDRLILALDTLQHGRPRGRPPKLLQELRASAARKATSAKTRKKRTKKSSSAKASTGRKAEAPN